MEVMTNTKSDTKTNRLLIFDIAKALGIIYVVLGHCDSPFVSFVCMFHMAFFFIIAGYFFSYKNINKFSDLIIYVIKKVKRLWLPYVITGVFFILLHNFLININFYTDNNLFLEGKYGNSFGLTNYYTKSYIINRLIKIFSFTNREQLFGVSWFFKVMFSALCISAVIRYAGNLLIKNEKNYKLFEFLMYILFGIMGYILLLKNNSHSTGIICTCMFIFYMGILYKRYEHKFNLNWKLFVVAFIVLWILNYFKITVNLSSNYYQTPFTLIVSSFFGFIFTMCFANAICTFANFMGGGIWKNAFIKTFSYIGKNTLIIMLLHFTAFKLITYLEVNYYHLPKYYLASFPVYTGSGLWWILYTISGLLIPLLLKYIWDKFFENIRCNK